MSVACRLFDLEFAADLDGKLPEVFETVLKEVVDLGAIPGQVIMDQNVPPSLLLSSPSVVKYGS
jgi:hypothetical protein